MKRALNFGAGPAALPLPVLQEAAAELLDFAGSGMSILEISHRSPEYDKVHNETQALLKELLGVGDNYKVLFLGGGASTQFAMLPMNFLAQGKVADYLVTGSWSKSALKEAKIIGQANVAASTEQDAKFTRIPRPEECKYTSGAAYVHLTSNNTIFWHPVATVPQVKAPLVADMSSDFFWRPFDAKSFSMIYAGAQKNLGPAGVTVVLLRDDFLAQAKEGLPTMLSYKTHADKNSLYNTPPCFAIYLVGLTLKWLKGKEAWRRWKRQTGRKVICSMARSIDMLIFIERRSRKTAVLT